MDRAPGLSVRLKLTLSYAGFLMVAGVLMLAAVWVVILRYIPDGVLSHMHPSWWFLFDRSDPLHGFGSVAAIVLAFLLVFGLLGGWLLAGRMLAPLTRITDATRIAATGSLSHRIQLEGRTDEFRELADSFDTMLARLEAHVAEQQRFAANASHELRTPLAITQTLLDVARNDPNRDNERARRPPPRRQHPSDRPHRSIAPAQPRRPTVLHPRTRRPVPHRGRSHRNAPPSRRRTRPHHRDLRRPDPDRRLTRAPAAADHEPRAERDRPQPARTGHRVGHDQRSPRRVRCSPSRTPARSSPHSSVATLAEPFRSRHQTHTHRPRGRRPRPGNRQEHHPGTRRNAHPHPPRRRRAPRHGATTRGVGRKRTVWPLEEEERQLARTQIASPGNS